MTWKDWEPEHHEVSLTAGVVIACLMLAIACVAIAWCWGELTEMYRWMRYGG